MVSKDDLGLIIGGVIAATAVYGVVQSVRAKGGGGGPPPGGQTYTVTIQVTDTTGLPVAGAVVTLGSSLPETTDSSGTAVFVGFAAGSYTLTVIASGFSTSTESVSVAADVTYPVVLQAKAGCLPQTCPCGSAPSLVPPCGCFPQKPATLVAPLAYNFTQVWYIRWTNLPASTCVSAWPLNSCPTCSPLPFGYSCPPCDPTQNLAQVEVQVLVKDVNGSPVCGVPVTAALPNIQLTIPFASSSLPEFTGNFKLSFNQDTVITDDFGHALFILNITLDILSNNNGLCGPFFPCTGNYTFPIPFSALFSAPGVANAFTSIDMQALICAIGTLY